MMRSSILAVVSLVTAAVGYTASSSADGFPNPSYEQLETIELEAHGTLFNMTLPANISQDSITNLQLIAFNELFEVAFFEQLLFNLTNHVDGFDLTNNTTGSFTTDTILIIKKQELHALQANQLLQHFGSEPIQPCNYLFPVSNWDEAIEFAALFTSTALGTLQEVAQIFSQSGDDFLISGLTSIIGQEGEQEGFFRILQDKFPSELPFLTTGNRDFTFTTIQRFIHGSCSYQDTISLNTFYPLELITTPVAETGMIQFSYLDGMCGNTTLSAVFINQQNLPIVEEIVVEEVANRTVTAKALFPYSENKMNGLTILTVTNSSGPFQDAAAVSNSTVFGPAFIIIN